MRPIRHEKMNIFHLHLKPAPTHFFIIFLAMPEAMISPIYGFLGCVNFHLKWPWMNLQTTFRHFIKIERGKLIFNYFVSLFLCLFCQPFLSRLLARSLVVWTRVNIKRIFWKIFALNAIKSFHSSFHALLLFNWAI